MEIAKVEYFNFFGTERVKKKIQQMWATLIYLSFSSSWCLKFLELLESQNSSFSIFLILKELRKESSRCEPLSSWDIAGFFNTWSLIFGKNIEIISWNFYVFFDFECGFNLVIISFCVRHRSCFYLSCLYKWINYQITKVSNNNSISLKMNIYQILLLKNPAN